MNTEIIEYDNIVDNLKDELRDHFRDDDYLVPEEWWEWVVEYMNETYPAVDLDESHFEFDIYRNSYKIVGSLDTNHSDAPILSDELYEYKDKDWIEDFRTEFNNTAMDRDYYYVNEDIIQEYVENLIFGDETIEFDDNIAAINTTFIERFEKAIKLYNDSESVSMLENWIGMLKAGKLFFSDTIDISGDDYDGVIDGIVRNIVDKIHEVVDENYTKLDEYISEYYYTFTAELNSAYNRFYTDEYADEQLSNKSFEIKIDEDGNQVSIVDFDGE